MAYLKAKGGFISGVSIWRIGRINGEWQYNLSYQMANGSTICRIRCRRAVHKRHIQADGLVVLMFLKSNGSQLM